MSDRDEHGRIGSPKAPRAHGTRGTSGIGLGRIFDVEVTVEWSFVVVFVLVATSLVAVFGRAHAGWSLAARIAMALVAALSFVASIVGHELAHAVTARRFGVPVHELRLFLLGGVSDLEREPPTPRAELLIALAGPAVSVLFGVTCLALAALLGAGPLGAAPAAAVTTPPATVLRWLGPINLVLGTFNLVPGFPLDGGRVLRALLWALTRDLRKATRWASAVGQLTGWTFVVLGLATVFGARIPFFGGGGPVAGVWLALIGVFLSTTARKSYEVLVIEQLLEGVKVRRLMRSEGEVVAADAPLGLAVDSFLRSREHMYPVLDDGSFVGLLSITDVARAPREAWPTTRVAAVMTPVAELVTAAPDDDATSALRKLGQNQVQQLPVVHEGRLVGVLEASAIDRWLEMSSTSVERHAVRT